MNQQRSNKRMTIGELAARFNLAASVLRHWESVGLLHSVERVSGQRRYREDHADRVATILRCQQVGLSLEQIKSMLRATNGSDRKRHLLEHRATLEREIAERLAAKAIVDHVLSCTAEDFISCPNFQRLVKQVEEQAHAGVSNDCSPDRFEHQDAEKHTRRELARTTRHRALSTT